MAGQWHRRRLDLPGLATLTGGSCLGLNVQAMNRGSILLTNLTSVTEGMLSFLADGTNSWVDLSALPQSMATLRTVFFEARCPASRSTLHLGLQTCRQQPSLAPI
jgi:hypothetical protein